MVPISSSETSVSNHLTPVIIQKEEEFSSTVAKAYDLA
jgi:hypothetical protein